MKQVFIKKEDTATLNLFFAGWGADEHLFSEVETDDDLLVCYDYRTLAFDAQMLECYRKIRLTAWSLGVWAAMHTLAPLDLPIGEATAINGTPFPVDATRGISPAIFEGTLNGLTDNTLVKFRRRMCQRNYAYFMAHLPQRPVEELKDELAALREQILRASAVDFCWDTAIIGTEDKIFLPQNQQNAWQGVARHVQLVEAEHYAPELFRWKRA